MEIAIKRLTPELSTDYFDFFENRAFTDDSPYRCYCQMYQMSKEQCKKEFENANDVDLGLLSKNQPNNRLNRVHFVDIQRMLMVYLLVGAMPMTEQTFQVNHIVMFFSTLPHHIVKLLLYALKQLPTIEVEVLPLLFQTELFWMQKHLGTHLW